VLRTRQIAVQLFLALQKILTKTLVLSSPGVNLHHATTKFLQTLTNAIFSARSDALHALGRSQKCLLHLLCTTNPSITWELIFLMTFLATTLLLSFLGVTQIHHLLPKVYDYARPLASRATIPRLLQHLGMTVLLLEVV
jgi:hypothetical protein